MQNVNSIFITICNAVILLILIYILITDTPIKGIAVASKEKTKELDKALGLVFISSYLDKNIYSRTIGKICKHHEIIPAAALRLLIDEYELNLWVDIADGQELQYPFPEEIVLIKDDNNCSYLFGIYNADKDQWLSVDENNNNKPLPEDFCVTKWKSLD